MKPGESALRLPFRRGSVEYCLGSEADHETVYQHLLHVYQGTERESFLGSIADPHYRPEQRLLAKISGLVVSHLHLTERRMRLGSAVLPLHGIVKLGTLPEYRGLGLAQNLLKFAEERAMEIGGAVLTLSTPMPQFYKPMGWAESGRQTAGQCQSRNLPASGDGLAEIKGGGGAAWHVRPWRQVELGDLMRLYAIQYEGTSGTILRSEEYWRWLIGRRYAHVIWVACQGDAVHGYAFVKDHRVLEIAIDPKFPQALHVLLSRIRAESLERAYPTVVIHAPSSHPAMEAFRAPTGKVSDRADWEGQFLMHRIPDPERFLNLALPELERRVAAVMADRIRPLELGLEIDGQPYLIKASPSQGKIEPGKLGRRHLTLSAAGFVRLALGDVDADALMSEPGQSASTPGALEAARTLFPQSPLWRSPLDSGLG